MTAAEAMAEICRLFGYDEDFQPRDYATIVQDIAEMLNVDAQASEGIDEPGRVAPEVREFKDSVIIRRVPAFGPMPEPSCMRVIRMFGDGPEIDFSLDEEEEVCLQPSPTE